MRWSRTGCEWRARVEQRGRGQREEKKKAQTTQRRFFRLEGGHTLGLLLVTELKVLAPGQRLVRLVFADGALKAEDHLLGGLGLRGGSNRGATTQERQASSRG